MSSSFAPTAAGAASVVAMEGLGGDVADLSVSRFVRESGGGAGFPLRHSKCEWEVVVVMWLTLCLVFHAREWWWWVCS